MRDSKEHELMEGTFHNLIHTIDRASYWSLQMKKKVIMYKIHNEFGDLNFLRLELFSLDAGSTVKIKKNN